MQIWYEIKSNLEIVTLDALATVQLPYLKVAVTYYTCIRYKVGTWEMSAKELINC